MVDLQRVAEWIGTDPTNPVLPTMVSLATVLIDEFLGQSSNCPDSIHDQAVVEVAAKVFERRNAPNGAVQFGPDGQTIFAPADYLASVKPMLKRYRQLGSVA